jgi:hypothetical protein
LGEALGPLGRLVAALLPPGDGYWEVHCHCTHDEAGCTDLHLHTCRTRRAEEPPPTAPAAPGAYL